MMLNMRTTLTLDSDVAQEVEALSKEGRSIKQIINEALRLGLPQLKKPAAVLPYHTRPHKMGLRPGHNLDNIAELLTQVEGDSRR
jgi:hypothetical protein